MIHTAHGLGHFWPIWWKTLADKLFAPAEHNGRRGPPRLDPRDLSEHMKRDMGYLDGRGPGKRRR